MKRIVILIYACLINFCVNGQKLITRTASISFYSDAPLEKIRATNRQGVCLLDINTNTIEAAVLMRGFEFRKALMQEHFNENYVESHRFPKAQFKGMISSGPPQWTTDGSYDVLLEGNLTIHGETRPVSIPASFRVNKGIVSALAEFTINVDDYKIRIPALVADNINKKIRINIDTGNLH
ncbi:YceI family protein [Flavihumibacter sediminis]|nr:YceI family protein [Flavihumibacter sediminis]